MRYSLPIRMYIQNNDRILDSHSRRHPPFLLIPLLLTRQTTIQPPRETLIGIDDRPISTRVFDILYPYWDLRTDDLLHGEWMDDFAAVVCELGGFVGCDDGD